jgi:hypothetical protein
MLEHDRAAFLDAMIEAVATKVWRDLSEPARAVLPVVGSHSALFGAQRPIGLSIICEHCSLSPDAAKQALAELQGLGLVVEAYTPDSDEPGYRLSCRTSPLAEAHAAADSVQALIDDGGLKVYGNLVVHVEQPSSELLKLTRGLVELLAAQTEAKERESARVAEKLEIVKYREPIPDPARPGHAAQSLEADI